MVGAGIACRIAGHLWPKDPEACNVRRVYGLAWRVGWGVCARCGKVWACEPMKGWCSFHVACAITEARLQYGKDDPGVRALEAHHY